MNRFTPSHASVTCRRPPEVSSTAFDEQPPDLQPVDLMDMGFAVTCPLARHRMPQIQFLYISSHLCSASFRPRLTASVISRLRFAITSRPSRCEEDLHLIAVKHVGTQERGQTRMSVLLQCGAVCWRAAPLSQRSIGFFTSGGGWYGSAILRPSPADA